MVHSFLVLNFFDSFEGILDSINQNLNLTIVVLTRSTDIIRGRKITGIIQEELRLTEKVKLVIFAFNCRARGVWT